MLFLNQSSFPLAGRVSVHFGYGVNLLYIVLQDSSIARHLQLQTFSDPERQHLVIGSKPPSGYTLVGTRPGLDITGVGGGAAIRQQVTLDRGFPTHESVSIMGKGSSTGGGGAANSGGSHFQQPKAVSALVLQNQTVVRREQIEGPVHHQSRHALVRGQESSLQAPSVTAATLLAPAALVVQSGPQHLQHRVVDHAVPAARQVLLTTGPVSPSTLHLHPGSSSTTQIFYQADGRALVGSARIPEGLPTPTSLLPRLPTASRVSSGDAIGHTFPGRYADEGGFEDEHRQKGDNQSGRFGGNDEDRKMKEEEGRQYIFLCGCGLGLPASLIIISSFKTSLTSSPLYNTSNKSIVFTSASTRSFWLIAAFFFLREI